ncbi:hypothetical protein [Burkholderia vietnamiensis]|uniref:hypothetical protein n=1 Tax=Burkholderia vietnamiensis TaxID=60552 RepID=UPI001B9215AF|nr:hypothetical protein [Burkholderia vietnamiensis]MBR8151047.1 hypothetical protein [Burkholderia vietnamiensis]
MVRTILEGRKTQTRRIVKVRNELPPAWATFASEGHSLSQDGAPQPSGAFFWSEEQLPGQPLKSLRRWPILPVSHPMAGDWYWTPSPYGRVGDRLYVRETWQHSNHPFGPYESDCLVFYRADYLEDPLGPDLERSADGIRREWRPSIHMPRAAARITLEITGVRVERLQAISWADAIAEGIKDPRRAAVRIDPIDGTVAQFRKLWDSLNAARGHGWDANPWVWVIEFRRIEP